MYIGKAYGIPKTVVENGKTKMSSDYKKYSLAWTALNLGMQPIFNDDKKTIMFTNGRKGSFSIGAEDISDNNYILSMYFVQKNYNENLYQRIYNASGAKTGTVEPFNLADNLREVSSNPEDAYVGKVDPTLYNKGIAEALDSDRNVKNYGKVFSEMTKNNMITTAEVLKNTKWGSKIASAIDYELKLQDMVELSQQNARG